VLKISRKVKHTIHKPIIYTYDSEFLADQDFRGLLIYMLNCVVQDLGLDDKTERDRIHWCINFDTLFCYDKVSEELHLKDLKYPTSKLLKLLREEFFGFTFKYEILQLERVKPEDLTKQ
jgi:hypothetical protein